MRSASGSPLEPNSCVVIASRSFRLVGARGLPSRNHLFRNPNGDRLHVATRKTFCENLTGRVSGLVMRCEMILDQHKFRIIRIEVRFVAKYSPTDTQTRTKESKI